MVNQLFRKIRLKETLFVGEDTVFMKPQAGIGPWSVTFAYTTSTTNTFVPFSFKFVPVSLLDILPSWACVAHLC